MLDYEEAMNFLEAAGICIVGNGTLFVDESTARAVAGKRGAELVEIRDIVPSAWLVKNVSEGDDELIEVIKKAIADAGLSEG